jgi:hypothetical protein
VGAASARRKKRTKTRAPAIVPRIVFGTAFIGVIPACVAAASTGGCNSKPALGVAYECFDGDPVCDRGLPPPCSKPNDPACSSGVGEASSGDAPDDAANDGDDAPDDADDADDAGTDADG